MIKRREESKVSSTVLQNDAFSSIFLFLLLCNLSAFMISFETFLSVQKNLVNQVFFKLGCNILL